MIKENKILLSITLFFGCLYALISLPNHYLFRTNTLDLGLYTNALYKYGHLIEADNTMIKIDYESILGGHFDLYLLLLSPFVYLFGTYTLLIIQLLFVLFGGIGIFYFFKKAQNSSNKIAYLATIYFLSFYGVINAISFDYHSIVIATSLIPCFFYYLFKQNFWKSSFCFSFILIAQEDLSLFLFFICIGLLFHFKKNRRTLKTLIIYIFISIFYFILVLQFVIPYFSSTETYTGFDYPILGNSPFKAIYQLVSHPIHSFKLLFSNHLKNNINGNYVKIELFTFLLLSGLFLLLKKPSFLVMLIPLFAQKMYNNNYNIWGIGGQYSVEFTPILAIGIFMIMQEMKPNLKRNILISFILAGTLFTTIRSMDNTIIYTNKINIRFYQLSHYQKDYDVKDVYRILNLIPKTAKISTQSVFTPHLSLRKHVYQFPILKDAEYIVFSSKESAYPISESEFKIQIKKILRTKKWTVKYKNDHLTVLLKKIS